MSINVERDTGSGGESYVVEGAVLSCTLGTSSSRLSLPDGHHIYINEKKQANIGDHRGGKNIKSFGACRRSTPPPACIMATGSKWVNGKENVLIDGEPALLDVSSAMCSCGGVISISNDGQ